jgi:hypothetical protein
MVVTDPNHICAHCGKPDQIIELKASKVSACIDHCIAPLVKMLNDNGIGTLTSCCGHGNWAGWIGLDDGRYLMIAESWGEFNGVHHLTMRDKKQIEKRLHEEKEEEE